MHTESGMIDVTRLRVALARLSRRLRRHSLAGLTPTQLAALSTVEQSGPLRLGDLAAAEGIAPSTLTRMVAVLEDLGYVRRDADPRDARASTLAITTEGHETLEHLREEGTALFSRTGQEDRYMPLPKRPVGDELAEELRRLDADQIYGEALGAAAGVAGLDSRPPMRVHVWKDPMEASRAGEEAAFAGPGGSAA